MHQRTIGLSTSGELSLFGSKTYDASGRSQQEVSVSTAVATPEVKGKTQQRVTAVVAYLRKNAGKLFTYSDLTRATGMPYDALLYVLHALVEVGLVEKVEDSDKRPGRPVVQYRWLKAGQEPGS